ncbi:MAG: hypothetical protein FWG58_03045 [Methanomassiliicoccaceae archaeon]|nr:hypothetical protein [Methanomassiliicoccaceae archaeon]
MTIFGVSGVSGIVGGEITPELAMNIGRAAGTLYNKVAVSRDGKRSGSMISNALMAGLCSAGCSVTDIGICPLPTSVRAVEEGGCGIMVTAPNNPSGFNGIRFSNHDGSSFSAKQIEELRKIFEGTSPVRRAKHDSVGIITGRQPPIREHMKMIMNAVGDLDCPVIVDCGSDSTSLITPLLLARMGADVTTMNSNIGKKLIRRPPEPSETNLKDLMKHVRSEPGSIGIAHDGNGSRVAAIDESGRYLSGNTLITLLASYIKADSVVVPINATMAVDEIVKGDVIRTGVGDGRVSEAMRKNEISFGGEPSGTFIFGNASLCPDGIYAAALIAGIASDGSLRQEVDELPNYPVGYKEVKFNGEKEDIAKRIDVKISSTEHESLLKIDGWRVEMDDGWYLVRISGSENKVRIIAEARDKVYMNCLLEIAEDLVASCVR